LAEKDGIEEVEATLDDFLTAALDGSAEYDPSDEKVMENIEGKAPAEAKPSSNSDALNPPDDWDEAQRNVFASWPRDVQQTYLSHYEARAKEFESQRNEFNQFRTRYEPYTSGLDPHAEYLQQMSQQYGKPPGELLNSLMQIERTLRQGQPHERLAAAAMLLQEYRIPVQALFNGNGQGPAPAPFLHAIQNQLQDTNAQLREAQAFVKEQRELQYQNDRKAAEVEWKEFISAKNEAGIALHPSAERLGPYMGDLIRAGKATTLQDAYKLATEAFSDILSVAQRADPNATSKQAAIQRARKAGSPTPKNNVAAATPRSANSLDEHISQAFAQHGFQ
jgi:hypothetical protein